MDGDSLERNVTNVKGAAAELRWGYAVAATLGAWTVAGMPGAWMFTATVLSQDDFRVSQRPLAVVTPNGWRWPVKTLQIAGGSVHASLDL